MNVAVAEGYQGKGIGSRLIRHVIKHCKESAINRLIIGTADTSEYQIRFYQKLGFQRYNRIAYFFVDHYDEPIFENGTQAKDMIMLEMSLS
ncbi:MAG: hypothetical protein Tsb0034_28390 [Ekhidna sp.]